MTRNGLWLAAAVVVVSNLGALGMAALNMQDEPDAVLHLTEREARLVTGGAENTAVSLQLVWTGPGRLGEANWFDQAKLTALGFDCGVPVTRENLEHYDGRPPRQVYAALEYEGSAWNRYVAGMAPGADTTSAGGVSHLMLVDLDRDAARLRARYPDRTRVAIVRAIVGLSVVSEPGRPPRLRGRVLGLLSPEVNLSRDLRRVVEPLFEQTASGRAPGLPRATSAAHAPRYVATIGWGRHLEPWAESIRMTDPATPPKL